jgi:hypothetical protein
MVDEEIRKVILKIFSLTRQSPGAACDETHFLDFLLHPPAEKNTIKNSFKGVKRYYDFFRAMELRFGICFADADQDKFYSLDKFVSKTKERIQNVKGNKMIIQRRVSEKDRYYIDFVLTIILFIALGYLKFHFASVLVVLVWLMAIGWLWKKRAQYQNHTRELYKKIMNIHSENQTPGKQRSL